MWKLYEYAEIYYNKQASIEFLDSNDAYANQKLYILTSSKVIPRNTKPVLITFKSWLGN